MDDQPAGGLPPPKRVRRGASATPVRVQAPATPVRDEVRPTPDVDEDHLLPAPPERRLLPPPDGPAPPPRRSWRRRLLWLLVLAILVGIVVWWVLRYERASNNARYTNTGAMPVGTATVTKGDMPVVDNALGTVTPLATVTVQTQINGILTEVGFQEGQLVKKGDFLAQIDPRPYQVALEQAEGQLAKDQAALADAELDLARYKKLVAQNAIASQTLDTQAATVAQDKGTVQTDRAQVDAQKLNLVYCHIISPITGRVGLRQVDPGNYIQTSSTTGIVVVTEIQPISVIFTLPEDSLPAVLKQVQAGHTLQAVAYDRTGNTQIEVGQLSTIDNQIDTTTGTLKLRATFANNTLQLFPNQFVNIKLTVDTLTGTNIVPEAAIQRGAPGTFVYLVKPDNTVSVQVVTLGPDDGLKVAVTKGLEPGQAVVTDGADRLKDGAKITVTEGGAQPGQQSGQQPDQPAGQHGRGRGAGQGTNGQGTNGQGTSDQGTNGQGQAPGQAASPAQPPPQPAAPGQPAAPSQPSGSSGG